MQVQSRKLYIYISLMGLPSDVCHDAVGSEHTTLWLPNGGWVMVEACEHLDDVCARVP